MKKLVKYMFLATFLFVAVAHGAIVRTLLSAAFNTVTSNSALRAFPVAGMPAGATVMDSGYRTAGDMPPAFYTLSLTACSENGGAGDPGAQIPDNTPGYCWLLQPSSLLDPRNFGAIGDGENDDGAAVNAFLAYKNGLSNSIPFRGYGSASGLINVDGSGLSYATSIPLVALSNLDIQHFDTRPLSAINFTTNNGVWTIPSSSSNVTLENNSVDLAAISGVNGFKNLASGQIQLTNDRVRHWVNANGLDNTGKWSVTNVNSIQWNSKDAEAAYPVTNDSGYALYDHNLGDSVYNGGNWVGGVYPVRIGPGGSHIRLIGMHTFSDWGSVSTQIVNPSIGYYIEGGPVQIDNCYLDSSAIEEVISSSNATPNLTVNGCVSIPYPSVATVPAWIIFTTNQANSTLGNFEQSNNQFSSSVPLVSLQTTGSGSWSNLAGTVATSLLASARQSATFANGGFSFFETSSTNNVASLVGSGSADYLNFVDSGTTQSPGPQVGSQGNNLALRVNGTNEVILSSAGTAIKNGITAGGPLFGQITVTPITTNTGVTYTAAEQENALIVRSGPASDFSDSTNNATALENSMNSPAVGSSFTLREENISGVQETLTAGAGVTLSGTMTIAPGTWRDFVATVTATTTPAITYTDAGAGASN